MLFVPWPCAPGGIAGTILSLTLFYISKNLTVFDIKEWDVQCNCYYFMSCNRLIRSYWVFPQCGSVPKEMIWLLVNEFRQAGFNLNSGGKENTELPKSSWTMVPLMIPVPMWVIQGFSPLTLLIFGPCSCFVVGAVLCIIGHVSSISGFSQPDANGTIPQFMTIECLQTLPYFPQKAESTPVGNHKVHWKNGGGADGRDSFGDSNMYRIYRLKW